MNRTSPGRLRRTTVALVAAVAAVPLLATAAGAAPDGTAGPPPLAASIRYGAYGIPQITAREHAGIGYGAGYAQAKDALCTLADAYLTADGERSRFLGPDATYETGSSETASGPVQNLASDLYYRRLIDSGDVERLRALPAPAGPRPEVHDAVRGFVAGYNRYVREVGARTSDPACHGAAWVRPITEATAWRHLYRLSTFASSGALLTSIATAQPPAATAARPSSAPAASSAPVASRVSATGPAVPADAAARVAASVDALGVGSNAIAAGRTATTDGGGVLLGNPHFPWFGALRFWQARLTIPGLMDVSGGTLLGLPLVAIGYTRGVAWMHTVSPARRFTPYQLALAPGSRTSYLVDGVPEAMTPHPVAVRVKAADGGTETVTRTLWTTRYGPVVTGAAGLPLPWTATSAFAIRDANAGNLRHLNTWLVFGTAQSTGDIDRALRATQGVPWVTTVATDLAGRAYYADLSNVPHVTDVLAAACNTPLGQAVFPSTGLPVLDGARTACAWGSDPDAIQPGTFGPGRMPTLVRDDYVTNSNGSAWLTNPAAPVTGYPRIVGDVGTPRSLRTRMGLTAVADRLAGTDGLPGRTFDRRSMEQVALSDRGRAAELVGDDLVALCRALPGGEAPSASGPVDASEACRVLAAWDRRYDRDSRGAVLFTRFWQRALAVPGGPWAVPFDPADPVATPRGLADRPEVRQALGDAVRDLAALGRPLDAAPGDVQSVVDGAIRIPLHGGPESDGVLNKITPAADQTTVPGRVASGSSFIQVVAFTGGACPDVRTVTTYSQSPDTTSPHFADQTRLFARKEWVRTSLCEQVPGPEVVIVEGDGRS